MDNENQKDQIVDLANRVTRSVVAVIDTCTARGGFRGEELSAIGQLRDQSIQLAQMIENLNNDASEANPVPTPDVTFNAGGE